MTTTTHKIEAKDLNDWLDPLKVLEIIGYEKSNPKISGGEVRDYCPIHRGASQQSLAISQQKKCFKCHSCACGAKGSLIDLYGLSRKLNLKRDFLQILEELASLTHYHQNGMAFDSKTTQAIHRTITPVEIDNCVTEDFYFLQQVWDQAQERGGHHYLKEKKIENCPGVRFGRDEKGNDSIVVPYRNIDGELRGIQYINKGKYWHKGSKTAGCFFAFGKIDESEALYVVEGLATAQTAFKALGGTTTVLSVGSNGNIPSVIKQLSERYQKLKIIVAIDVGAEEVISKIDTPIKYCIPSFDSLKWDKKGENDKGPTDFNDIVSRCGAGLEEVKRQLSKTTEVDSTKLSIKDIFIEIDAFERYFKTLPEGIDIGLNLGSNEHDKILLPSGGFTTFAAPTKHGKSQVLINAVHSALGIDKSLQAVFVTLEELKFPILMRLLNLDINEALSKNNIKTLHHYYKELNTGNEFEMFGPEYNFSSLMEREEKREMFRERIKKFKGFCEEKRFGIIDFTYRNGAIGSIEYLCREIERLHRSMPNLRLIAIDYIQLLSTQAHGRTSRDEMLKEVCLQLKDVAAKTRIAIITAAQFNRTVLNEDSLITSAIGEAGSIERQSSMVIGMWNRTFQQYEAIGKKSPNKYQSQEVMLKVMLNRYGQSGQELIASYDGNIGKVDFEASGVNEKYRTNTDRTDTEKKRKQEDTKENDSANFSLY